MVQPYFDSPQPANNYQVELRQLLLADTTANSALFSNNSVINNLDNNRLELSTSILQSFITHSSSNYCAGQTRKGQNGMCTLVM